MIDAQKITAARHAAGLTQSEAAALVDSTASAWQKWELGKRNMPTAKWELFNLKIESVRKGADATKEKS